ncbi:MAG: hypothetical protein NVS4B10_19890 [Myxococcales bacterium]
MRFISALAALALAFPAVAQTNIKDVMAGQKDQEKPTAQSANKPAPPPTVAAPKGPTAAAAPASNADLAKRSFDLASANLQAAKSYVGGLNDLAQKASTWDRESSVSLFNSAQRAVTDAEEHGGRLVPLAKGDWAKATDPLNKARADLVKAQGELRTFSGPVRAESGDPASRQGSIKGLWDTLETASKDLNSAAGQMSVDTKLKTP